jgi:DNA mismatch endonuclease (patch repair protein)
MKMLDKCCIELIIAKELRKRGLRFSRNSSTIEGKPDFVFRKEKLVLFLDSCFWHVCPYHHNIPKSNKKYWVRKLKRNKGATAR